MNIEQIIKILSALTPEEQKQKLKVQWFNEYNDIIISNVVRVEVTHITDGVNSVLLTHD